MALSTVASVFNDCTRGLKPTQVAGSPLSIIAVIDPGLHAAPLCDTLVSMTEATPKFRLGDKLSLEEFVAKFLLSDEENKDLERLAKVSEDRKWVKRESEGKNFKLRLFPYHWEPGPQSDEFLEQQALHELIEKRIREVMTSGLYSGSGRPPSGYERKELENKDWESAVISIKNWTIGSGQRLLTDILIQASGRPSNDALLAENILDCMESLNPPSTSKSDIRELVTTQSTFTISGPMFDRAWERALEQLPPSEREKWTKRGRKKNRL
ncbi:hypothetical protein [Qipengyuania oceanensis]|uniref:Uncharacterized protein n=1 Tax=Qipengyuania oceanensis TaxID=1463597 RepID=A0A844YLE6_9SPHN|nr:hypothetical protein [Qipengyuania oceanensis]MXO63848.1 hypothetical protein [Qipengyuania oceanensis]